MTTQPGPDDLRRMQQRYTTTPSQRETLDDCAAAWEADRAEVARLTAARTHLAELSRDFLNDRNSFQAGLALRDETIRVLAAALLPRPDAETGGRDVD